MNKNLSIILTCHNKENLIGRVLKSIITNTSQPAELIVVLDGCTDNSEAIVDATVAEGLGQLSTFKKIYTPDVFETKANNAGMKVASGDYFILVQDDMVIHEKNWDTRILKPFFKFDDVISVTSKTAHNIEAFKSFFGKYVALDCTEPINRELGLARNIFAIRDSANRGPLALDAGKVRKLNYLDEEFAPYNWDEHDLNLRAYTEFRWVSGCYWIDYESREDWGTTKNKNKDLYTNSFNRNSALIYEKHKKLINGKKHNEDRIIEE